MKVAMIGGTGDMGFGLALRFAKAGHSVVIGSRSAEKAQQAAEAARAQSACESISGASNHDAAQSCDLIVLSMLSAGHGSIVAELRDVIAQKPVLDVTIPIAFKPLRYEPPPAGSNALETKALLGEGSSVAAGFHTISAGLLADLSHPVEGDVLVVGDEGAKTAALALAAEIGLRAFDAGSLVFSPVVESQTPMLIGMNKRYGSTHIGIRLTGL